MSEIKDIQSDVIGGLLLENERLREALEEITNILAHKMFCWGLHFGNDAKVHKVIHLARQAVAYTSLEGINPNYTPEGENLNPGLISAQENKPEESGGEKCVSTNLDDTSDEAVRDAYHWWAKCWIKLNHDRREITHLEIWKAACKWRAALSHRDDTIRELREEIEDRAETEKSMTIEMVKMDDTIRRYREALDDAYTIATRTLSEPSGDEVVALVAICDKIEALNLPKEQEES